MTRLQYYVPTALEKTVGLKSNLALVIGGAVQCMFFVGSLVPTFFLDKMGRRRPMMWGSLGLAISMMMLSILLSFHFKQNEYSSGLAHNTSSAAVAFFFIYMLIFGATANCIPWVYVPEILPLHARAKGTVSIFISRAYSFEVIANEYAGDWYLFKLALGMFPVEILSTLKITNADRISLSS